MNNSKILTLVFFHIALGFVFYIFPSLSNIYSLFVFAFGLLYILKNKNNNNEALLLSGYVVGIEVFFRMTEGGHINEYGKYSVILFLFIGILFQGFSKKTAIYWVFLILLVPGVFHSFFSLSADANLRKNIAFNISGPICLGICAVYCMDRKISFQQLLQLVFVTGLPIILTTTFLFFKTPSVKEVITGTQSNFETSGGFGPNQVSTILGLGMFLFFILWIFWAKNLRLKLIFGSLVIIMAYRGLVTFSRGGTITGFVMILATLVIVYLFSNAAGKLKLGFIIGALVLTTLGTWSYSVTQTSGLIVNRYANEDALGRKKKDALGGRERIQKIEFKLFLDNPIIGMGVGKSKEARIEIMNEEVASHNEMSRMLVEHGLLGIVCILILLFTPIFHYINNKHHLLLIPFFIFWFLTIQHAAMRTAAPAFIYSLSLLKIYFDENSIHRE